MENKHKNSGTGFTTIYCCNPFEKSNHKVIKSLRPVQGWMFEINSEVRPGMKICDSCRKQLLKEKNNLHSVELDKPSSSQMDTNFIDPDLSLEYLNKSLSNIEESPIIKKRLQSTSYCKKKMEKVTKKLVSELVGDVSISENEEQVDTDSEMIVQLKEKFKNTTKNSEKFLILTTLPKSWTVKKIEIEFRVSNRMARKAKSLVKEKGIMSCPDPKPGKTLDHIVADKVKQFYNSDDVSRIMPGKKDFVAMKVNGKKEHVQKRLVLLNLKECYELFKKTESAVKIGFSKFAELRPKNCILAGGNGTHSVCVCTTHQNVKLMIVGGKLKEVKIDEATDLGDYKQCLSQIMCQDKTPKCYLNQCDKCPGVSKLKEILLNHFEEEMIETIMYKQWVSVDRCTFETFCKTVEEFVESFCEQLVGLKKHSFISRQQSKYYKDLKENIREDEAVVSLDFSENYSFVVQDEAQSFHWNNDQATLHPFAVYYNDKGEIKYTSFVIISQCLIHDSVAVHLFQRKLISFLKSDVLPSLKKIYYFSDGSAAQYKNRKNFINICNHNNDFGIETEWHFFATAHGKGTCDGLGGTVKRLAAKASLQRPYHEQIMTPLQLFVWSEQNIPKIKFEYCTNEDYSEEESFLKYRLKEAETIKGTQQFHTFIPQSLTEMKCKIFSSNDESCIKEIVEGGKRLNMDEISGYVTCEYDRRWWLASVLSKDDNSEEVELIFLHPSGPAPSFVFPRKPDILKVNFNQILTRVNPTTATGRTYTISHSETMAATKTLTSRLQFV